MTGGPEWQYYSMPESIVGGAHDLDEARQQYRSALAFSLDVPDDRLPEIRELVEYEADKGTGIWVRGGLGSRSFDNALKFLTQYFQSQATDHIEWFFEQPAASGDVVVVPVELDDTLQSVTTQMTPFDSVWVVAQAKHADGNDMLLWLALGGSEAATSSDEGVNLTDLGLTTDSFMRDVFALVIGNAERQHSRGKYALATV